MSSENCKETVEDPKPMADSVDSLGAVGGGDLDIISKVRNLLIGDSLGTSQQQSSEFLRLKKEGNDFFSKNEFEKAIEKYDEAEKEAANDDERAALLHNKGASFEKLGKEYLEKAIEAYSNALAKKPNYYKVLSRRCKLLVMMGKYAEAFDDIIEMTVAERKHKLTRIEKGVPTGNANLLVEVLTGYSDEETKKVLEARPTTFPPSYIIESFLRPFYADPVSRIWKGLDVSPVDELIKDGKAENLKGYMAALRELKLKNYENIPKFCTDEINNPESEETKMMAYFLRGTIGLIWASADNEAYEDIAKVIDSPLASNQLKSSAYLKLALRYPTRSTADVVNLSEGFSKAEESWPANTDVYFHGAVTLIERAHPVEALEMLELGLRLCGNSSSVLMQTLYWTIKFSVSMDDLQRHEASSRLLALEPLFDCPDCHEMYSQALMMCGEHLASTAAEHMEKALAYNPNDPIFKVKKLVLSRWTGEEFKDCLKDLYAFVEAEPLNSIAYYHIGQLEITTGNMEKGFAALDKSIELSNSVHEISGRIASKLEMQFHLRVNLRLVEEGLEPALQDLGSLSLKSFV